jgi:hypothetical protein
MHNLCRLCFDHKLFDCGKGSMKLPDNHDLAWTPWRFVMQQSNLQVPALKEPAASYYLEFGFQEKPELLEYNARCAAAKVRSSARGMATKRKSVNNDDDDTEQ